MLDLRQNQTYFISCPPDCEKLLQSELKQLGIENSEIHKSGVQFTGGLDQAFAVILNSRIASRAFVRLQTFKFKNEKEVAKKVFPKDWSDLFSAHQTFKVTTIFDRKAKKKFRNSMFFSQMVKDGMVDHFMQAKNKRPSIDTKNPDLSFALHVAQSPNPELWFATLSLDLTGFPLSNRGYRLPGHGAPMRENLAAAIVSSINFNADEQVFIDSMTGTGTLLIEMILKQQQIAPSYLWLRKGIQNLAMFKILPLKKQGELKRQLLQQVDEIQQETEQKLNSVPANTYFAFDIADKHIDILKKSLVKTGLNWKKIRMIKKDATRLTPPDDRAGVIVCNPPYGKRLGEEEELEQLYYDYGENLKKNFKGYSAYVFTANPELRKKISLQTSQRIPFHNGEMECRLLRYDLY